MGWDHFAILNRRGGRNIRGGALIPKLGLISRKLIEGGCLNKLGGWANFLKMNNRGDFILRTQEHHLIIIISVL